MDTYLILSYAHQQSYVRLHAFTKNLDDAKAQFNHLTKDLLVDENNECTLLVEMVKVNSEFVDKKGLLLFFGPEHSAIGKKLEFEQIERMYQWNNGLSVFNN
jgi:hypothetical protein